ncbi:MAG TPA: hypothetical protein VGF28_14815 [Thermoanaerobaculia bacterium]|jgi:hypothetical protein
MRWAIGLLVAGYFVLLVSNTSFFAAGPDTSGYLSEARLLASGRTSVTIEPLAKAKLPPSMAYLFTPYGFMPAGGGRMVPTYPVGTPLHLAAAAAVGGWRVAPFLVAPLAAVASLFLFVAVAGEFGLSRGWAIAGAALLGAYPVFISMSLQPMSDVLATAWTLAAVWCALKSRHSWRWAAACSVAFCIGVAVRPSNVILALPLAVAIGFRPARLAVAAAAALPFAAALMWYHDTLYGSPWATGYGSAGRLFSFGGTPPCLGTHVMAIGGMLTPLIAAGFLVAFDRLLAISQRLLLLSWLGVFLLFYSFYSYCPDPTATRFLLPALPPLLIGFLRVVSRLRVVAVLAIVLVLAREVVQVGRMHTLHHDEWESIYPRTVAWVEREVPRDAVVLSAIVSGAFYYQAERITVRWDQLDPPNAAILRGAPGLEGPWYAVVSDVEGGEAALRARVPGDWRLVGKLRDVALWRLDPRPGPATSA